MAIITEVRVAQLSRKRKTVTAEITPRILERMKENRVTGLERSNNTVPFRISRLMVCAEQTTATTREKIRLRCQMPQKSYLDFRNTASIEIRLKLVKINKIIVHRIGIVEKYQNV